MKFLVSVKRIFFLVIIFSPVLLISQDYIWPTNASEFMSSSFCEFREGHYHAAIDIKTWNTEGYPCYAIADGHIKRIRVSPFGYGKVIYLQLNDGNTVIYAHLQKFTKKVEKLIRQQQFKNQKYNLNWWPKNLKVKKGDIIAYTGRTGIGVPHLHFEIRNKKDNPINPLQFYTQVKDHRRPKLQDLLVVPLDHTATINDSYLPQRFPLIHVKDGIYVIKKPIVARGYVGLAIRGYDQADEVYNKYGFYQSTLESSGKLLFQITYDELDYTTTEHIFTEIYYPYWSSEKQIFNKLFLEPFNSLEFYNRHLGSDGSLTVKDKPVSFKITISDYMNNKSIIKGELLPTTEDSVKILSTSIVDSSVYIKFNSPPIRDLKLYTKANKQSWSPVDYFEIIDGKLGDPTESKLIRMNLSESNPASLKLKVNKSYEQTVWISQAIEMENLRNNFVYLGDRIIGEYHNSFKNPRLHIESNQKVIPSRLSGSGNLEVMLSSKNIANRNVTLQIDDIYNNTESEVLDYHTLVPKQKDSFNWYDSTVVVESNTNSVMDTMLVTAYRYENDSTELGLPAASKVIEIKPDNFPIFQSISISIKADSLPQWGKWSVFKTNGEDRFDFLRAKIDTNTLYFTARTSSLGKFIIAADTVSPDIMVESPRSGKVYKSTPKIKLFLKDSVSGIGGEEDISLTMDGQYVLPEWDPEEDVIIGFLEKNLSPGNHVFTATVRDRSGNVSRQAVYFRIRN